MSNWVSCLVIVVVLFCLASRTSNSDPVPGSSKSGLAILTTTKPSFKQTVKKLVQYPLKALKSAFRKKKASKTKAREHIIVDHIIALERIHFVRIHIHYENEKFLNCGGTIVNELEVLTDAGCFMDTGNPHYVSLKRVKLLKRELGKGFNHEQDATKVEVYWHHSDRRPVIQKTFNIARVTASYSLYFTPQPPIQICPPEVQKRSQIDFLSIVGWRECNVKNWVDINVMVNPKSDCNQKYTTRYGEPDAYCAAPIMWDSPIKADTSTDEEDMSGKICTDRGGPVLGKGPDDNECLVGVINDGDLSNIGNNDLLQEIIFTSLNRTYLELQTKEKDFIEIFGGTKTSTKLPTLPHFIQNEARAA